MPATATQNSIFLGYLGRCNTERIVTISCHVAQGGQGKYCFVSLSLMVLLTIFAIFTMIHCNLRMEKCFITFGPRIGTIFKAKSLKNLIMTQSAKTFLL
jgi:hypothetical protein